MHEFFHRLATPSYRRVPEAAGPPDAEAPTDLVAAAKGARGLHGGRRGAAVPYRRLTVARVPAVARSVEVPLPVRGVPSRGGV